MDVLALKVAARFTDGSFQPSAQRRIPMTAATLPSRAVLGFLRKATKGLKGSIDLNVVEETFKLLGAGWGVQESVGAYNLTDSSYIQFVLKAFCTKHNCKVWGYSGVKEPKEFWFETREEAEAALPALKAEAERCGPKGPTHPQIDKLYIAKIEDEITQDFAKRWRIVVVGVWYGRPSYVVTTPAGAMQFIMDFKSNPANLASDRFWKLVYQSGIKDLAQQILTSFGDEAVDKVLRPSTIRDLTNTGTCPVCFGNFKLTPKTRHGKDKSMPGMVLHGYNRPGTGYIHGNCFGQDWPPFELSKEGTVAYIVGLEQMKMTTEHFLGRLKRDEVETLPDYRNNIVKKTEAEPKMWAHLLERQTSLTESRLGMIERDLKQLHQAVAEWKPMPLPGAATT